MARFRVGELAASKRHRELHLVVQFQESAAVLDFESVVVLFDLRAELHFLEVRDVLLPFRPLLLLVLLVFEFPEVHHAANRRLGGG